jgi:NAD(P)-dependent dehydrogenase (short-subunit alcohol dehydrogenase family)
VSLFRPDLLAGRRIAVAGTPPAPATEALAQLGAELERFEPDADDDGDQEWARTQAPLHALVYDARGAFAGGGGAGALRDALEQAWIAGRAIAAGAMIPGGDGGKLILVSPSPGAGDHAEAARAALENLARTLSIEWARHSITAVAIAPSEATTDVELGELLAFLCSHGGDYYTGCRLALGTVAARPRS